MTRHWFRYYRDFKRKVTYRLMSNEKKEKKDKLERYKMRRAQMQSLQKKVEYKISILNKKIFDLEKELR